MKIPKLRLLTIPLLLSLFTVFTATPYAAATVLRGTASPQAVICGCTCFCVLPGFSIASSTYSLSLPYNHLSDTATISDSSILNFNGTINLSASVSPGGLSAFFSPSSICVGVGPYCFFSATTSTLTVSASTSTPNGDYTVMVTGTSGSITHSFSISVNVPSPFIVVASPPSITALSGQSQDATITVQSLFGYSGAVDLTSSASPSGPSVSFAPPSVTIASSGPSSSATSTLTFESVPLGNYSITITGTSGSFTNAAVLGANATDFNVKNNPGPSNVQAGSPYSSKVDIGSLNGFTGTVHFSATVTPAGPKITLSPDTLNVASGGKASTMVTVLASNPGTYSVNVTGTSGSASRSVVYTITIAPLPPTIFGLAPMNFYGLVGGIAVAGVVGAGFAINRRRKSGNGSAPVPPTASAPSAPSPPDAGSSVPAAPGTPAAPKKGLSKLVPGGPSVNLPKPLVEHKVPILLVAVGTVLVVAALATISPAAGLFGGLFIPGILFLGLGSVVLFLQLYQRPVAVRRFCMHCGFQMPMTGAGACPRCGKQPMSGIDTRVCPNCNAVIPTLAKFCKDCGAGQPNVPAA